MTKLVHYLHLPTQIRKSLQWYLFSWPTHHLFTHLLPVYLQLTWVQRV